MRQPTVPTEFSADGRAQLAKLLGSVDAAEHVERAVLLDWSISAHLASQPGGRLSAAERKAAFKTIARDAGKLRESLAKVDSSLGLFGFSAMESDDSDGDSLAPLRRLHAASLARRAEFLERLDDLVVHAKSYSTEGLSRGGQGRRGVATVTVVLGHALANQGVKPSSANNSTMVRAYQLVFKELQVHLTDEGVRSIVKTHLRPTANRLLRS